MPRRLNFGEHPRLLAIALGLAGLMALGLTAGLALKRRGSVVQDRPRSVSTQSGNVIRVAASGNLQRALDQAQCGDTIIIIITETSMQPRLSEGDLNELRRWSTGAVCNAWEQERQLKFFDTAFVLIALLIAY